jgi:hypothetical protein
MVTEKIRNNIDKISCILIAIAFVNCALVPHLSNLYYKTMNGSKIIVANKKFVLPNDWILKKEQEHMYNLVYANTSYERSGITFFKNPSYYPNSINNYWEKCQNIIVNHLDDIHSVAICVPNINDKNSSAGIALMTSNKELIAFSLEYNPLLNNAYMHLFERFSSKD